MTEHNPPLVTLRITVAAALQEGSERLRAAGVDNPRLDARLLLAHVLGCSQTTLLLNQLATINADAYRTLLARREAREPLAYLVGRREFWSLGISVSAATLIPRPDSETLIEAALAIFDSRDHPMRVLDLGTGTGCLLLAVLHERPNAFGIGVDRALDAAALARRNAATLGLADRSAFLCGDWAEALRGRFDLILCNPPYVTTSAVEGLMPEVSRYEPRSALDGGYDGYDAYRRIIPALPDLLEPEGAALLELGTGQASTVARIAAGTGLSATFRADLAGIARVIVLRWPLA